MTTFKQGDIVRLKTGESPKMTIDTIKMSMPLFSSKPAEPIAAICVWFIKDELKRAEFSFEAIELYPTD